MKTLAAQLAQAQQPSALAWAVSPRAPATAAWVSPSAS